jgi:membrane-bound lytic murein transglycosylase MltF
MRNLIQGLLLLWCLAASAAHAMALTDKVTTRKGDLDAMLDDRLLRVLVVYDNANFYLHQGRQDGLNVSLMREFERWLNNRYFAQQKLKMNLVFLPVRHDQLLPMLNAGKGDLVLASLGTTEGRRKQVDFSIPDMSGLRELLVSSDKVAPIQHLTELSGKHIWVRKSSSYYESLQTLNDMLASLQRPPVYIEQADELLQDSDLLQMVSLGAIPYTLVDSHKARLWGTVFSGLRVHDRIPLRENGSTAWAFRKNSPQLEGEVNAFLKEYRQGTTKGDPLYRRYLQQAPGIAQRFLRGGNERMGWSISDFQRYAPLFQRYADQYQLDWMMLFAQAYQESTLNQGARSRRGAMGVMQVLPSTAREPYINVRNIASLENNVHAGTKYMRYMMDTYFGDAGLDDTNRALFTLAAYNAGPNRIARYREEAARRGLNGNIWFDNVEKVAATKVGAETVQYVKNVSSRYVAYRRSYDLNQQRKQLLPR